MGEPKGWLLKEGPALAWLLGRQWLRRYFTIDATSNAIVYYTEPDAPSPRGTIQLAGAELIDTKTCLELKGKDFCFGIRTSEGRTFFLIADDAGIARKWVTAITQVIANARRKQAASTRRSADRRDENLSTDQGGSAALDHTSPTAPSYSSSSSSSTMAKTANAEKKRFPRKALEELDLHPATQSHTSAFIKFRRQRPAKLSSADNELERLKNRVFKLLYNDRSAFSSKDAFEKSIVTWDTGSACKICNAGYSFTKSKTHCRLCGATVCDSDGCSNMLNLIEMGRLTGVMRSQPPLASDREAVVPVCVTCESRVKQAGRGAAIAKAGRGATQLQTYYEQACRLRAKIYTDVEKFEGTIQRILAGNTAPALKQEAERLQRSIQSAIADLADIASKIDRLPVQDKKSQRLQFQSGVAKSFTLWGKETKWRVASLADAIAR
ncbi:hypothetical protein PTSG_00572 [Salpingoeca rosetta]|uniref:PH domain-containing protein n=1 Tax=Salpingoeca rosetta (strain ATCC 50818 / BSB-021) TaxID=946362 RepID=F2TWV2_SALR5|nr:uncharacterized protein PTSG_00572 [Salpingoeca rosetta]EGD72548.1 hypothetical protein PTSG_00572 [Salpingoeca rosetta]|eukprot:XP_004999117.1 hypothetical protein PTSG_00572 [Salpingoeca rosetta]